MGAKKESDNTLECIFTGTDQQHLWFSLDKSSEKGTLRARVGTLITRYEVIMIHRIALSFFLSLSCITVAGDFFDEATLKRAAELRETALKSDLGYQVVESLTTEVGPRMAGTPGDRAGVAWAQAKLKELGFDKVWKEEVTFPYWIRGTDEAEVISPYKQPLAITALGHSVGTPDEGIEAELFLVPDYHALEKADPAQVKGKIVFINNRMERTRSGEGYGKAVVARSNGASAAAKHGAVGLLIRSVGTDSHRFPHTGVMTYLDGVPRIPAAALSGPDANLLELMISRGKPVRVNFHLSSRDGGTGVSHNVIGEIRGREKPEEVIIIGAHLDSWDLGTGALDDGAGVGIVVAAAKLISQLPQRPRRTIRVVLFANEEAGLFGARAYAQAHANDLENHIIGAESDFGAGLIYNFQTRVSESARPLMEQIGKVLKPLGIDMGDNNAGGGPDLQPLKFMGMPVVTLKQDGTDYFDYHHTADDTLDKIVPEKLAQNVAAYAVFAYLTAETTWQFRDRESSRSGSR